MKSLFWEKYDTSHREIFVSCTIQEYDDVTKLYYPIFALLSVVSYRPLETKEHFKLLALKVVSVSYERRSLTRCFKYSDSIWKLLETGRWGDMVTCLRSRWIMYCRGLNWNTHDLIFFVNYFQFQRCLNFFPFVGVSFFLPWSTQASLTTRLTSLVSTANRKHSVSESAKQVAIQSTSEWKPALSHAPHTLIRWITRLTSGNSANAANHQLKFGRCLICRTVPRGSPP